MNRFLMAVLFLAAVAWFAPAGQADVDGECFATLNGDAIAGRSGSDAGDAFHVGKNGTINLTISSTEPVRAFRIDMEYGFGRFNLHDESFPRPAPVQNRTGSFQVADFAQYGSGIYRIVTTIETTSDDCTVVALVAVDGNPLTTLVGAAALGGAVLGLAGLIQTIVGGYQQVKEVKDSVQDFRASAKAVREATEQERF